MPRLTLEDPVWTEVTLSQDELFFVERGAVYVTLETPIDDNDLRGTLLVAREGRVLASGSVVNYRPRITPGVESSALLVRDPQ